LCYHKHMNLTKYEEITGLTVPTARQAFVTAQLNKTRRVLERLLGFTLVSASVNTNQYTETGKTQSECPCPSTTATYDDPDAVIGAYRLFPYNPKDRHLLIDPASAINKVKLVNGSVTYRTFEADEFRPNLLHGFIKSLEVVNCCWTACNCGCNCHQVQLAVDANWLWEDAGAVSTIPDDLLDVWAEMTTYYSDSKKDIKSETLGPHSYSKKDSGYPEEMLANLAIIKKYAGPLGSVKRALTQ